CALAGAGDTVFSDELNHASIVDGCRLSRAEVVVYRHRDVEHLDWCFARHGRGRRLVVTDSVFSMDGDVAPLAEIAALAGAYGARVVVDEAHATGSLGAGGRGAVAEAGLEGEIDVVIGTLGKALGSYGAYACASAQMIRYLLNTARSLIFSTAPPPPAVAGALAALDLLRERPHRVQRLRSNARALRRALAAEGFPVADSEMQIVPLIVGAEDAAMRLCQEAIEQGIFAQAIRPPTVSPGTSRLRLTVMASHTHSELELAAGVFGATARRLGLAPERMQAPPAERLEYDAPLQPAGVSSDFGVDYFASAPFDLERDADLPEVSQPPASWSLEPFEPAREDREDETAEPGAAPVGAAAARLNAPFDLERELSRARAA
ncbi:MAG TPA: aminotransferase class I/II-fold pyridoxal phosphate-dependent enzyme, partial [Solirubrobacteraceae bacterium]